MHIRTASSAKHSTAHTNEPRHEISNNVVCVTSKASDQPAHTHSLIRAFASRLTILSLKGCCTGSSESIHVKIPHCWKSHVTRQVDNDLIQPHSPLAHCLLVSSVLNFCKQFGPRSGRQNVGPYLDPSCLTLWWYSWKNFSKKLTLKKISRRQDKKHDIFSRGQRV